MVRSGYMLLDSSWMSSTQNISLAERYIVEDLRGASQTGARLNGILAKFDEGLPISNMSQDFLLANDLHALHALVSGQIEIGTFRINAARERTMRMQQAQARAFDKSAELAEQAAQQEQATKDYFAARANDPRIRRQREAKELRRRFGIGYVDTEHYPRVMALLRRISNDQRIPTEDVAWLQTEASDCWTDELRSAWNVMEAKFLSDAWQARGDPWDAINASSHWRKADQPRQALSLAEAALTKAEAQPKTRSALLTTCGGALRDLDRLDEAKAHALDAHRLAPRDFRPCTLLGAVHMELGDIAAGHEWFVKAEKLGADVRGVDHEIRTLLARASKTEQKRIREYLTAQDPDRFAWLQSK
jgi:hypothetical protein